MGNKNFRFMFFIYFVLFGIFIALFGSFIGYNINLTNIQEKIDANAQEIADIKKTSLFKPNLEKLDSLVEALASSKLLNAYIETPNLENKDNVTQLFYTMAMSNNQIMQTRFLDSKGMEKIRIDRNTKQDIPILISDTALQDKSSRDYFQTLSRMNSETIWHSRLDLNIENGKIEVPYRPTIRIAKPIMREQKFVGMVILNILATELINSLNKSTVFEHYVIDKEGNFISHPNEQFSWSKYTHSTIRLHDEFPTEAQSILAKNLKGESFYAIELNDVLNNEDEAMLILKPKELYKNTLIKANTKTSLLVVLLSLLVSIPLAIFASLIPARLQQVLATSNAELKRFTAIIDKYVITATTSPNSIITSVSTAFAKSSGYSKEELVGQKINIIKDPKVPAEIYKELWQTIEKGGEWVSELKNRRKDGSEYWLEQNIIPIKNEHQAISSFMSIGIDITDKKEVERLSEIDKLTGIYNRRKLDTYMESETQRANRYLHPLSVMLIDIDHFKSINDTYGHTTGDTTLKALAGILMKNIRNSDIVGRYGGEEFLIICPETTNDEAFVLAEKIRKEVSQYDFPSISQMTISIGIGQYHKKDTINELLNRADSALYQAKDKGRNCVIQG